MGRKVSCHWDIITPDVETNARNRGPKSTPELSTRNQLRKLTWKSTLHINNAGNQYRKAAPEIDAGNQRQKYTLESALGINADITNWKPMA